MATAEKLTEREHRPPGGGPLEEGRPAPTDDESLGSLGSAFLSAGFGTDGSLPDDAEAAPRPEEEPEPPSQPEARPPGAAAQDEAGAAPPPGGGGGQAAPEAAEAEAEAEPPPPVSPYDLPGSWYVIHSYSGYEKKVKDNLATRISSMHMEDSIFEVVIPTEKRTKFKGGRMVEVEEKMFPGYLLVRMRMDDNSWHAVRNTPGVTSFVTMGSNVKPTPLSKREVERFLGLKEKAAKAAIRFRPAWKIGEAIRVTAGPFADFNGVVEDINVDQEKVKVLVEIFGRDTAVELGFGDIQKQ